MDYDILPQSDITNDDVYNTLAGHGGFVDSMKCQEKI